MSATALKKLIWISLSQLKNFWASILFAIEGVEISDDFARIQIVLVSLGLIKHLMLCLDFKLAVPLIGDIYTSEHCSGSVL